jgi:hypothetical protein
MPRQAAELLEEHGGPPEEESGPTLRTRWVGSLRDLRTALAPYREGSSAPVGANWIERPDLTSL